MKNMDNDMSFKLAKTIVYDNVKKALGLDKTKYILYGGAPMNATTRKYFMSLNIILHNAYIFYFIFLL